MSNINTLFLNSQITTVNIKPVIRTHLLYKSKKVQNNIHR